ncbi:hypothetical protein [Paenibacillus hamazuiensis]|uniref:hypothetical protein n=1 Tax=Paenibacillus hamazuiensis TaxID=2936508 RepID=UPI00200DC794|nr:hypothetical protein [Paenibacillus hamazuiensis]
MDWKSIVDRLRDEIASGKITLHQVLTELDPALAERLALLEQVKEAFGVVQDEWLLDTVRQANTQRLMSQFVGSLGRFPGAAYHFKWH